MVLLVDLAECTCMSIFILFMKLQWLNPPPILLLFSIKALWCQPHEHMQKTDVLNWSLMISYVSYFNDPMGQRSLFSFSCRLVKWQSSMNHIILEEINVAAWKKIMMWTMASSSPFIMGVITLIFVMYFLHFLTILPFYQITWEFSSHLILSNRRQW